MNLNSLGTLEAQSSLSKSFFFVVLLQTNLKREGIFFNAFKTFLRVSQWWPVVGGVHLDIRWRGNPTPLLICSCLSLRTHRTQLKMDSGKIWFIRVESKVGFGCRAAIKGHFIVSGSQLVDWWDEQKISIYHCPTIDSSFAIIWPNRWGGWAGSNLRGEL